LTTEVDGFQIPENSSSSEADEPLPLSPGTTRVLTWILIGVFIVVLAGTIYVTTMSPPAERFTEFYLLGPSGIAAGYPTNLTLGEQGTVIVGITNREGEALMYLVHVWLNDTKIGESWNRITND
jgi:uncharacterized membrane protein